MTFIGNSSTAGGGGAIESGADASLIVHSTFVANSSSTPGASLSGGPFALKNSILSFGASPGQPECASAVISLGGNIERTNACGLGTGDLTSVNPMLDPAGAVDHGGATPTVALLAGSPAIDWIVDSEACLAEDQRGDSRPGAGGGAACDAGAYEY